MHSALLDQEEVAAIHEALVSSGHPMLPPIEAE